MGSLDDYLALIDRHTQDFRSPVASAIANTRPDLPRVKQWEREQAAADAMSGPPATARDVYAGAMAVPDIVVDNGVPRRLNQFERAGSNYAEMTGLPQLKRGIQHLANSYATNDPRAQQDEALASMPDIAMGGLGLMAVPAAAAEGTRGLLGMLGGEDEGAMLPRREPMPSYMPVSERPLLFDMTPNRQFYARPHGPRAAAILREQDARIKAGDLAFRQMNEDTRRAFEALGGDSLANTIDELDSRTDRFASLAQRNLESAEPDDWQTPLAESRMWGRTADRLQAPDFRPRYLSGNSDIAADPLANLQHPRRMPSEELPARMAMPREDRYLFGRLELPPAGEPVTPLPRNPVRELGPNAMPIAPAQPFRNSLRGGSEDLMSAARQSPDGGRDFGDYRRGIADLPHQNDTYRLGRDDAYIDFLAEPHAEEWFVRQSQIDDSALRGQGRGVAMYEDLLRRARESGVSYVASDIRRSVDSDRIYEALARRGYNVQQNGGRIRVSTDPPQSHNVSRPLNAGRYRVGPSGKSFNHDHLFGNRHEITDGEGGSISYTAEPDAWHVREFEVPKLLRGQGRGVALYEEMLRGAQEASVPLVTSDRVGRVSLDAQHIYSALKNRGWRVTEHIADNGDRTYSIDLRGQYSTNRPPNTALPLALSGGMLGETARRRVQQQKRSRNYAPPPGGFSFGAMR